MSLYDKMGLLITPNGVAPSKIFAYKPTNGSGDGVFDRNTTATRVNSAGLIENVAIDMARIDYPTNGSCPHLLLESQSSNLIKYSEDFSQSYWSKLGATVVSGQDSPSLDSPLGAFKLTENSANSSHRVQSNFTSVDSTDYTLSVFAKKGERNYISLQINPKSNAYISTIFNLDNGTIVGQSAGASAPISSKIKYIGNGFYKCEITVNSSTGSGTTNVRVFVSDNPTNITYQGDGTSGVYIYGAQLEALPYATSYIPTSGSAVTRVQDVANNFGDVNTFNSSEGVLFFEGVLPVSDLGAKEINISGGTISNAVRIQFRGNGNVRFYLYANGVQILLISIGGVDYSNIVKVAVSYKSGNSKIYINGVQSGVTNTSTYNFASDLSELDFLNFYGGTKQVQVYKEALTDLELEYLTTYATFPDLANANNYNLILNT